MPSQVQHVEAVPSVKLAAEPVNTLECSVGFTNKNGHCVPSQVQHVEAVLSVKLAAEPVTH